MKNWELALHTYRSALSAYRRLLEIRAERDTYRTSATPAMAIPRFDAPPSRRRRLNELTAREREVADLVARGYTNKQIADLLVVSQGTVANHIAHILPKLGATNRTQVAVCVLETSGPMPDGASPTDGLAAANAELHLLPDTAELGGLAS